MNTVAKFLRLVFVTLGLSGLAGPVSAQTAALDCQKLTGDKGIAACDRAIRQDPKNPVNFYNRGISWSAKGDKDRAISDYNQAIRLNPQYADAFYNRGTAWSTKGDKDKAISEYNEAIRLNPQYAYAFYGRGLAWSAKGFKDKARSDYNEAIRLLRLKFQGQHPRPAWDRMLRWTVDTSTLAARNVA